MTYMVQADVKGFVTRTKWRKKTCREHLGMLERIVNKAIALHQLASENMEFIA